MWSCDSEGIGECGHMIVKVWECGHMIVKV